MSLAGARVLARRCPAWRRRDPDYRGFRDRSEEQLVQDLESDVLGVLLPAGGQGGGDTETAWRRGPRARRAHRGGQNRADRGGPQAGGEGRADLPSGLLRLPAGPLGAGRGGGMPRTLLAQGLGVDLDIAKFFDSVPWDLIV